MNGCLCCQQPVPGGAKYHPRCLTRLFGRNRLPRVGFDASEFADQVAQAGGRMSLSGVQIKLSVRVEPRLWALTAVSEGGTHILKPESKEFPNLPQNENLCMNLATEAGLPVPPHGLLPLSDGALAYVVKRFDRQADETKLAKETFFQILGAKDKYQGSMESVAKAVRAHATNVGLDLLGLFERLVLCFLTGNGDMHLKNWALLTSAHKKPWPEGRGHSAVLGRGSSHGQVVERVGPSQVEGQRVPLTGPDGKVGLAPCYDFVSSRIYLPKENETALTVNGKHHGLTRTDFKAFADGVGIDPKASEGVFQRLDRAWPRLVEGCRSSDLSGPLREKLTAVMKERSVRLFP